MKDGVCPFCKKRISVLVTPPAVAHEWPPCEEFVELDAREFLVIAEVEAELAALAFRLHAENN